MSSANTKISILELCNSTGLEFVPKHSGKSLELRLNNIWLRLQPCRTSTVHSKKIVIECLVFTHVEVIPHFAVRSSSAHEGKIIILERFNCSLTSILQLKGQLIKLIGNIEICSI